jgi:hypothetical protein
MTPVIVPARAVVGTAGAPDGAADSAAGLPCAVAVEMIVHAMTIENDARSAARN